MRRLVKKHTLATRVFHWLNVLLLGGMIYSGLMIYWANQAYDIRIGKLVLFPFFPRGFFQALELEYSLAQGIATHLTLMWPFALNGLLYVVYSFASGHWRELRPQRGSFRETCDILLGVRRPPHAGAAGLPYNGAQRIAYTGVIVMAAGSLATGLAIYKPVRLGSLTALLGGYESARWLHFLLTLGFLVFIPVHVAQVVRCGWNTVRAMWIGVVVVDDGGHADEPARLEAAAASGKTP